MTDKKEMNGAACAVFMAAVMVGMGVSAVVLDRVVMPALSDARDQVITLYQNLENSLKHNSLG